MQLRKYVVPFSHWILVYGSNLHIASNYWSVLHQSSLQYSEAISVIDLLSGSTHCTGTWGRTSIILRFRGLIGKDPFNAMQCQNDRRSVVAKGLDAHIKCLTVNPRRGADSKSTFSDSGQPVDINMRSDPVFRISGQKDRSSLTWLMQQGRLQR